MSKVEEQRFLEDLSAKGIKITVDKDLEPITDIEALKKSLKNKDTRKKIKISVESLQKFYEGFAEYIQKDFVLEGLLVNKISNGLFTKDRSKSQNIRDFEFKYGIRIISFKSDIIKGLTVTKLIEYIKSKEIKLMIANSKALNDNKTELPELEEIFNELIAERDNYLKNAPKKELQQLSSQTSSEKKQIKQDKQATKLQAPEKPQKRSRLSKNTSFPKTNNDLIEINTLDGRGIKNYKEIIDKYLRATYIKYGKDAAILAFEQYYEKNGSISRVKVNGKNHEFKGKDRELRALKVLIAKYVEYVLNFEKNKDNNFYNLSPKERRLYEAIVSLYSELESEMQKRYKKAKTKSEQEKLEEKMKKLPEEIVKVLTNQIREFNNSIDSEEKLACQMPEMQGVSIKDIISIMVSSEISMMIEKEKISAETKKKEPEIQKTPLEEKWETYSNNSDNIRISAIRYIKSVTSHDNFPNRSTAKANIQARKTQLLNYFINSVDDKGKDAIKIIPNIDLKKLELVLESIETTKVDVFNVEEIISNSDLSNIEKINLNSGTFIKYKESKNEEKGTEVEKLSPKAESVERLNSYLESANGFEAINFDSRLPYWKKTEIADLYLQRAVNVYAGLKVMIDKTRKTITEKKVLEEPVEQYEKVLENLLNIYDRMMSNGNDKLIANYIAIKEAQKEFEQSTEKNSKSKGENITR